MSLYLKDLVTVFFLEIRDDGLFVFFSIHSCSVAGIVPKSPRDR